MKDKTMFKNYVADSKFMLKFTCLGSQVIDAVTNNVLRNAKRGVNKENPEQYFTYIREDMKNLLEYLFLSRNLTDPDTSGYSQHMTKKQFDKRFGKLCEFYDVD